MIALLPLSGKKFQIFRSWPMDYGGFEKKVFWVTRFDCIWYEKVLRVNAYFST